MEGQNLYYIKFLHFDIYTVAHVYYKKNLNWCVQAKYLKQFQSHTFSPDQTCLYENFTPITNTKYRHK